MHFRFVNILSVLAVILYLLPCTEAIGREVDWTAEPLLDLALFSGSMAIERCSPESHGRAGFPTQSLDESARDDLHGKSRTPEATSSESGANTQSDLAIAGLIATSSGLSVFNHSSEALAEAMTILHTFAITNFTTTAMKYAVHRRRPKAYSFPGEVSTTGDHSLSFPSGHSANAFAAATAFSLLNPESHWAVRSSFFLLAGFVGYARIAADKHFLTDVIVGAGVGAGSAGVAWWTFESPHEAIVEISVKSDELTATWRF